MKFLDKIRWFLYAVNQDDNLARAMVSKRIICPIAVDARYATQHLHSVTCSLSHGTGNVKHVMVGIACNVATHNGNRVKSLFLVDRKGVGSQG